MSFDDLKICNELKIAINKMKYTTATAVQLRTIPWMINKQNVIVKSHTGSGKTAAFGIPISENIFTGKSKGALILCPTRELAVQVMHELRKINSKTKLNVSAVYGGHGMNSELREIKKGIDILCATPGRLQDHFRNRNINPKQFDTVVLDEADRMLDMGFISDLNEILEQVQPKNTNLFSATLDGKVAKLIQKYIPQYEEVILADEIIGKTILETHIKVPQNKKIDALLEILEEAKDDRVLLFVATKRNADFLARILVKENYNAGSIHGNKTQRARETALHKFKTGKTQILVATDVAARGLQIDNVEYVVNYDLAQDADTHKHRIGRTGRMGKTGQAITFVDKDGSITKAYNPRGRRGNNNNGGQRSNNRRGNNSSRRNADYSERNSDSRRRNTRRPKDYSQRDGDSSRSNTRRREDSTPRNNDSSKRSNDTSPRSNDSPRRSNNASPRSNDYPKSNASRSKRKPFYKQNKFKPKFGKSRSE